MENVGRCENLKIEYAQFPKPNLTTLTYLKYKFCQSQRKEQKHTAPLTGRVYEKIGMALELLILVVINFVFIKHTFPALKFLHLTSKFN